MVVGLVVPFPKAVGDRTEHSQFFTRCVERKSERILAVLEGLLAKRKYAAGDAFAIADIVHFGWLWRREFAGINFDGTPNIARWYSEIAGRPSVHRAIERVNALVQPA
jgi:GSH-dependent disulfide-bond oxidoreductase